MQAGAVKAAEAAFRASGNGEQDHPERYGAGDGVKRGFADGDPNHVGDMGPGCAGRQSPENLRTSYVVIRLFRARKGAETATVGLRD